jgi:hypothetical protein
MVTVVSTRSQYDPEPFRASVHKELLCYYSEYYTAVLKSGSSSTKKDDIKLNLSYHQASHLVCWLYTATIAIEDDEESDVMGLYVFADEKKMLALRRSIMSRIIEFSYMDKYEGIRHLKDLREDCGLFRYMVDFFASEWSNGASTEHIANLDDDKGIPRIFFYQALSKLSDMVDNKDASMATLKVPCNYHEHSDVSEWHVSKSPCCSDSPTPVAMLTKVACHRDDSSCDKPVEDYYKED